MTEENIYEETEQYVNKTLKDLASPSKSPEKPKQYAINGSPRSSSGPIKYFTTPSENNSPSKIPLLLNSTNSMYSINNNPRAN
jgi:hypothetical protein